MTPEQIKVLEALRDYYGHLSSFPKHEDEQKQHDALTAALEYIRDMRELEASADYIRFPTNNNGHFTTIRKYTNNPDSTQYGHWATPDDEIYWHKSCREAFKAVKEGKD